MASSAPNTNRAEGVRIVAVESRRDRERFLKLPERLYRDDPNWVPPLLLERRILIDPRRNPFFENAQARLFLALDSRGTPRGRIAAVVNRSHLAVHGDGAGFFGLFECERDPAVAAALFDAAGAYLRGHGLGVMRGPENLSVNDDIGLLVEGFDSPPAIMMPHNPPWYSELLLGYGFAPCMRLWAYRAQRSEPIPERLTRAAALARERHGLVVRAIDVRRFREEIGVIHAIYTEAWRDNWGAVPVTRRELEHAASAMRWIGDPELCLVVEVRGEPAGFSLTLPDLNQALARAHGRIFPLGLLRLLWHRRRVDGARMLLMGVARKFRYMAVDACLYHETLTRVLAKGYRWLEMSWVLENNLPMNRVLQKLGARIAKTYQLYDCRL